MREIKHQIQVDREYGPLLERIGDGSMAHGVRTLIEDRLKAERTNSQTLVLRDFLAAASKYPELAAFFLESTSKQWESWHDS